MGFFATILGAVSAEEMGGIHLEGPVRWEVAETKDMSAFLRALPHLLGEDSVLYLEDVNGPDVSAFLQRKPAKATCKVALGTIWPRPNYFHLDITEVSMQELAKLAEGRATPEVCIHLHAYKAGRVLLEWHDAFDQPMWISDEIPEEKVAEFCRGLNCTYQKVTIP